jgi:hypothetical protein
MSSERMKSFKEFWPFYVCEHGSRTNRKLHFVGTFFTLVAMALALYTGNLWWLLGVPVMGYGFAWVGHFIIEKNRPATFKYPLYSLAGDYKMFFLTLLGKMDREVEISKAIIAQRRNKV